MNPHHDPQPRDEDNWSNALHYLQEQEQTMKISEMLDSKYLKTQDIDGEVIVTVKENGLKKLNLARDDEAPEYKWTIMFHEFPKSLVLNKTNLKRLEKALGDETDDWEGKQVVLYVDDNIQYGADIVSGLRIKAVRHPVKAARAAAKYDERNPPPIDADGADVPF